MNAALTLDPPHRQLGISNERLGFILLIGTETILFTCFIGAYLVLRMGAVVWPPAGTPVLTWGLSAFNTLLLVLSSVVVHYRKLLATFWMGTSFLALQVLEFHRLYARGLTLHTGAYGSLFYSLITCHGLHVMGGLVILALARRHAGEWGGHAEIYWHFVTVVWFILFSILYFL